jgi:hypothetical protein
MAINEHKNLDDANRHQPKGFESAANDTVLSKDIGTGTANTDGSLEYQSKNLMGTTIYQFDLFSGGNGNYKRCQPMSDGQSPNDYSADTGQTVATSISLTPSQLVKSNANQLMSDNTTVYKIKGWCATSGSGTVTFALCKVTPVANNTSSYNPVVLKEFSITGLASNNKLVAIEETSMTVSTLSASDFMCLFVKDTGSSVNIYAQISVSTTKY